MLLDGKFAFFHTDDAVSDKEWITLEVRSPDMNSTEYEQILVYKTNNQFDVVTLANWKNPPSDEWIAWMPLK